MSSKRPVDPLPRLRPKSAAEWRRWLQEHHRSAEGVMLEYARKGSGEPSLTWDESVDEALCFGWVDGVRGRVDELHFTVRFTPRKTKSIWSKLNIARVERLIEHGKMRPAGLAAFEHGKRAGSHDAAYSVSDEVPMPKELTEALRVNARGRKAFEALPPGQKKAWARSVSWAKQEATRRERARDALLLLLAGRKPGETDNQAARRGVPSKKEILGRG